MSRVHVVGAGLAGLSAALGLVRSGMRVALYEAAPQAGGRCRSFFEDSLDRVIDNGGHVLMGANRAAFAYLDAIGGRQHMVEIAPAEFPFLDLASGETWSLRPNAGRLPWWVFSPSRRIPGTSVLDYLAGAKLLLANDDATVSTALDANSLLFKRLWDPLATAVMNAVPAEAAARPLGRMLLETFGGGERACRPWVARNGLSAALVDPALAVLDRAGTGLQTGWRLAAIEREGDRVTRLRFADRVIDVAANEAVVLAVPRPVAVSLLPELGDAGAFNAIVNAHFRLDRPARFPGGRPLLGLVNGTVQWLIAHDDIVSVTVSAADAIVDQPAVALRALLWADVAKALGLPLDPMPPTRVIKEKRATFAQTPAGWRQRPAARTRWRNLVLAGDWTDTGIPATIEGSIRSGNTAANCALGAF